MSSTLLRLPAAALALLFAAAVARADLTDWSYSWNRASFAAAANGGTRAGSVEFVLPGPGESGWPVAPLGVRTFTSLLNGADRYEDVAYSLTFTITDPSTGRSHAVSVNGQWDGTVTSNGVSLTNTFLAGSGSQTFDFLGHDLAVKFGFTATGSTPLHWSGEVTASVSEVGGPGGQPSAPPPVPATDPGAAAAPEPASVALACLALPALGLVARRKRRL